MKTVAVVSAIHCTEKRVRKWSWSQMFALQLQQQQKMPIDVELLCTWCKADSFDFTTEQSVTFRCTKILLNTFLYDRIAAFAEYVKYPVS